MLPCVGTKEVRGSRLDCLLHAACCCIALYAAVFSFFISDAGFIVIHGDILDRTVRADSVLSESFCLLAACSQI